MFRCPAFSNISAAFLLRFPCWQYRMQAWTFSGATKGAGVFCSTESGGGGGIPAVGNFDGSCFRRAPVTAAEFFHQPQPTGVTDYQLARSHGPHRTGKAS